MALVTVATLVYWLNPPGNPMVDMIALFSIGFLIYGPVMLIGACLLAVACLIPTLWHTNSVSSAR